MNTLHRLDCPVGQLGLLYSNLGGPMGAVAWLGNLSLTALTVAFLLPYASRLRSVPEPERAEVRQTT